MSSPVFQDMITEVAAGRVTPEAASRQIQEVGLRDLAGGALFGTGAVASWEAARALARKLDEKRLAKKHGVMPTPPGGSMGRMIHQFQNPTVSQPYGNQ